MNHRLTVTGMLLLLASAAGAQPTYGTLIGNTDADILDYECVIQDDAKLRCSFVQVQLRNRSDETELAESLLQIPELLADPKEILENCKAFSDFKARIDALEAGEKIEGLSAEDDAYFMNYMDSGASDLFIDEFPALEAFCQKQTPETADGVFRALHNMSRTTCQPFVNKYDQTFVKVNDGLWVVESSPSSDCGIVNLSSFYLPNPEFGTTLWNYRAQKTVTNKTGKANGVLDCTLLDETPQEYQWNSPAIRADCMFLD